MEVIYYHIRNKYLTFNMLKLSKNILKKMF